MSELSMSMFATREDYEAAKKAAMGDVKLPELPKPALEAPRHLVLYGAPVDWSRQAVEQFYTVDQMREYARAAMAPLIEALETIAAQDSGVVGSTSRADCMAAIAALALRKG
jgi:hypothetical protein